MFKGKLTTRRGTYEVDIIDDGEYTFTFNGVVLTTDFLELLTIESPHKYTAEQLAVFDYVESEHRLEESGANNLLLQQYALTIDVPVSVLDKQTAERRQQNLQITISHDQQGLNHRYALLSVHAERDISEIDLALEEMWVKLEERYEVCLCAFCQNMCWNPYGGMPLMNQLCFKASQEAFGAVKQKDKASISRLVQEENPQAVYLIDSCEDFIAR
ncbi:MAG: hypothetical protein AAF206_20515 [Bacteroidota bacterium]